MSVAVCRSAAAAGFESWAAAAAANPFANTWLQAAPPAATPEKLQTPAKDKGSDEDEEKESVRPPGQSDIWSSIQKAKEEAAATAANQLPPPYVHPLVRRSSGLLSQKSLEICTESLGSETGSEEFLSSDDDNESDSFFSLAPNSSNADRIGNYEEQRTPVAAEQGDEKEIESEERVWGEGKRKELATVNYHCSISRRSSQPRCFPPPLPSISRRDGPCLQMRPHRRDGRLVVEAVTVPSQNYLHAERQGGRLLLSFINTTTTSASAASPPSNVVRSEANNAIQQTESEAEVAQMMAEDESSQVQAEEEPAEAEEDPLLEEEEEVEVVDRGTVVEVKVSTQPQQSIGGGATAMKKVHRSSIVINKFVSCMPTDQSDHHQPEPASITTQTNNQTSGRRPLTTTSSTTAAAAAMAASSRSTFPAAEGTRSTENKLLFTSRRRRNKEELLHDMRRCSQLRRPLFIWEPCCIATSS